MVAPPPKAEAGFLMSVSIDGGEKEILGQRGEMNASLVYDDFMGSSADGLEVSRRLKFAPMVSTRRRVTLRNTSNAQTMGQP